jgi:hypothetical protein
LSKFEQGWVINFSTPTSGTRRHPACYQRHVLKIKELDWLLR